MTYQDALAEREKNIDLIGNKIEIHKYQQTVLYLVISPAEHILSVMGESLGGISNNKSYLEKSGWINNDDLEVYVVWEDSGRRKPLLLSEALSK